MSNLTWLLKYGGGWEGNTIILPTPKITLILWVCERVILSLLQVGLMLAALFKKLSFLAQSTWEGHWPDIWGSLEDFQLPNESPGESQENCRMYLLNEMNLFKSYSISSVPAIQGCGNLHCQMCALWLIAEIFGILGLFVFWIFQN